MADADSGAHCTECGAPLSAEDLNRPECPYCQTALPHQLRAAKVKAVMGELLADRDGNGIPDVFEQGGALPAGVVRVGQQGPVQVSVSTSTWSSTSGQPMPAEMAAILGQAGIKLEAGQPVVVQSSTSASTMPSSPPAAEEPRDAAPPRPRQSRSALIVVIISLLAAAAVVALVLLR